VVRNFEELGVRVMKMKNEKGFSLVELLVVVIIIAIVAAIAIPNLLASRRAANEASATASMRTIHSAEATYQATVGGGTLYASLVALNTAGLIDSALGAATSQKSGYDFAATLGTQIYCATAAPTTPGTTGNAYFGVETEGVIWKHTAALTCAAGDLTPAGAPIQ
jgi:type IV pilus assembly protein PilA